MKALFLSVILGSLTGATFGGLCLWAGVRAVGMEDQTFKKAFWTNIIACIFSIIAILPTTPAVLFIGFFEFIAMAMITFIVYLIASKLNNLFIKY